MNASLRLARSIHRFAGFAALILFVAPLARGATAKYKIEVSPANSSLEFLAVGRPSALKIRGKNKPEKPQSIEGKLKIEGFEVSGEITIRLDDLDTGIEMRDRHMREKYLETDKFPLAVFQLQKLTLPHAFLEGDFVADEEPFKGDLTMREITNPITGNVSVKREDNQISFDFSFSIKIGEFKIASPGFKGITMANEVNATFHLKSPLTKF